MSKRLVAGAVNLRRAYFECRHGQLHVRTAFPSTGGFDERTPLLCLHESPLSSRVFREFLPVIGGDRSVYALDAPGHGESDPVPLAPAPTVSDYAAVVGDFLDALRLREVDLLGCDEGAAIATEVALARPLQVRRLVLAGLPLYSAAERAALAAVPWLPSLAEDGDSLRAAWQRAVAARGADVPLAQLAVEFATLLANGAQADLAARAVQGWAGGERLAALRQPVLVLRRRDRLWEATARGREHLPRAEWCEFATHGSGAFSAAPAALARPVREFLDR